MIQTTPETNRLQRYELFDKLNRPYLTWQLEQFEPYLGQRILEIGCGVGGIIALLGTRQIVTGLDVEEDVLDYATQRFRDRSECHFRLLDITRAATDDLDELRASHFDSVVCINVLEHIEDDLAALKRIEDILVPGGVLALLIPAHMALYGSYDRIDGHFRRYSKRGLRQLLTQTSFIPIHLRYFNSVGAVGWWLQYKLLRRQIHGASQFGVMNRLIPLMRPIERLVSPPFGLSLVAICKKQK